MKPRERRETGEMDLFRSRLDQIINMNHELVGLAEAVSWEAIEARCGEAYSDGPGIPRPQCTALPQVQGLYFRPEAPHDARHQA